MATVSSVVLDHDSLNDADELDAANQIISNLSATNRYLHLKYQIDQMSDADQIGFNAQYKVDSGGKEVIFFDAPDPITFVQKGKKFQPATGA